MLIFANYYCHRWALKYGNPILSSAVVISNTVILSFYRNRLKLKNYGRFTLFLPIVIIPSIFDQIFQNTVCVFSNGCFKSKNLLVY